MRPIQRMKKRSWPPEGTKAWYLSEIRKRIAQADAGLFATDEEVAATFEELRRPRKFVRLLTKRRISRAWMRRCDQPYSPWVRPQQTRQ